MSSLPCAASHSASGNVNASVPRKPPRASTCCCSARQRTDLLARRIGLPAARCSRVSAFASIASRSTSANGACRAAVARSRRAYASADTGRLPVHWPEHALGPRIGEAAVRIQSRTHRLETIPLGVTRSQGRGRLEVALAPVRTTAELVHDLLDRQEVLAPRHPLEHVHGDEAAVAARRGTEE